jgi:hypothetical protein
MIVLLAVMLQTAPLQLLSVRSETAGAQQKLVLDADRDWGPVSVERKGVEIVASLPAQMRDAIETPAVSAPLQGLLLVRAGGSLELRIVLAADVPYEVQRKGRQLVLVFGTPARDQGLPTDLLALYESLRPPRQPAPEAVNTPPSSDEAEDTPGIGIGPLRFRPALIAGYSRSDTTIDGPTPLRDTYFQVEPRLGSTLSLWDGRVQANYEPQVRMRSRFAKINRPSHEANARAEIPVGGRIILRAGEHYSTSTLDTLEVDPGREYFFNLGRFTRTSTALGAQIEIGPRLSTVGAVSLNHVRFHEDNGFFSYEQRQASGGLEFLLSEGTRARLAYTYEKVPESEERPLVAHTADSVTLTLGGEPLPLVTGSFSIGYRRENAPGAAEGGRRFEGPVLETTLAREFSRGSRLTLDAVRQPYLSSFESNAFYVGTSVHVALESRLPLGLSGRAGGGYHWNAYRTVSATIGEPRRDRLYGWTAGLSRPLSRWSYVRVDYAWDRRDSNIEELDNDSSTLLVQLGIGLFGSPGR